MIRLDEHALREDKAYREAYRLVKAHREHMEAVYRGLFDALTDALTAYFTRATERAGASDAPPVAVHPPAVLP